MRSLLVIGLALAASPAFAAPPSAAPKHALPAPPLPAPPAQTDPFDLRTAPQLDDLVIENKRRDTLGRDPYRVPPGDEYRFQFCELDNVILTGQCETRGRQQPRLFLLSPDLPRFVEREAAATRVQQFTDSLAAPLPPPCEPAPTANKPAGPPSPCPAPR